MAKMNQLTKSDYLPIDEYQRLVKCLHKDKLYMWELYVKLSFCTALRASDVLSIKWSDILQRVYMNKTEKKTGKTRHIPFSTAVQNQIERLYHLMGDPSEKQYIFQSEKTDGPITIQCVNHTIKKWKERYNIQINNFSTHTFRKTFGRSVYDQAEDKTKALVILNSIFKHANLETTKVYIGLREDEINSVFQSIS